MKKRNALIILERPWYVRTKDQNTTSVLPFFEGLAKLTDKFDLYHSNFYEAKSFELALDELTRLNYENYYIYIACHGAGQRLESINLGSVQKSVSFQ